MSPGATFERVYLALKEQVVTGVFRPGQHLEPAALSVDLISSITPVRDALHRLVGERLVHTPRGDGFRMPFFTEAALRDLYGWNQRLLQLALSSARGSDRGDSVDVPASASSDDIARATAELFAQIARLSGSAEHLAVVSNLNDRLHFIRREEGALMDVAAEFEALKSAFGAGDLILLRRLLASYHRRRMADTPRLLQRLQPSF